MRRLCMLMMLFAVLSTAGICEAVDNDPTTVYYRGERDFPVWVERDDYSRIVFRLSTARVIAGSVVKEGDTDALMIIVDGYEIDPSGYITSREIRDARKPSDCYVIMYALHSRTDSFNARVMYPISSRFPNGTLVDVDNPYQFEICAKIITAAADKPHIKF